MDNVKEITEKNFDDIVMNNELPVLVDFWASWCGPCRMVGPVVEQLADHYEGKLAVGKVNVDEQPALSQRFQVMSIPTILIFKDGEILHQLIGARPYDDFTEVIDQVI